MALNELLNHAYSFTLSGGSERTLKGMQFIITAPGRGRTWYTGAGLSIVEAIDAWFERVEKVEGIRLRRANLETLQEAKENAAEIIQFYD